ncbi:MAG: hypothetical protein RIB98_03315 [Acidimicrobiales bacterium]
MAATADVMEFTRRDVSPVVARMEELADRGDGWMNLGPGLTPEEFASLPAQSTVGKWVSGRGPAVPMATWTPAPRRGRGRLAQIGISHGTGPNALARLESDGVVLPADWQKKQDHAKHGIVVELPDSAESGIVLTWLFRAMVVLSPRVAVGENWIAEFYGSS